MNTYIRILIYGTVLLFALRFVKSVVTKATSPLNQFPGPWYAKWTNLRLKLAVVTGQRIHYVHEMHQAYGHFVRISPTEISVSDIDTYGEIHQIGSGFNKSQWYHDLTAFERQTVFVMSDPRIHAARRRLLARAFSKTYLRDNWEVTVHSFVDRAVTRMDDDVVRPGTAVDVLKWFTFMATDISSHLMFGNSRGMIEKGKKDEYIETLEATLQGGGIGAELPLVRSIGRYVPIRIFQSMFNSTAILLKTATQAVEGARGGGAEKNLFAHIIAAADKGEQLDDLDVQLEATALIVAGSDTTAVTMTYLVWAVLSRPAVLQALQEDLAKLPETYNNQDLEGLPVLSAIIDETLRLYGAAPGALPRVVPKGGVTWANGKYHCPAGTVVSTQSYTMHRDVDVFARPEEFDYQRWIDPEHTHFSSAPKSSAAKAVFTPFGAGARTCIGIHLARMELRLATAAFFKRYPNARLAPSTTPESMAMENFFLIAPRSHKCEIILS